MNTKSISSRIAVSIIPITLVIGLFIPACTSAASMVDSQHQTGAKLIEAGHCVHMTLTAMESENLPANEKLATISKLCKPIGFVAGAAEAYNGGKQLSEGRTGTGSMQLTGAAANTISACAGIVGQVGLRDITGAVGASVDGAMDVYHGVHGRDNEKVVVGGIKCTAGILMSASAVQPELAPVLVPVSAVTYVGAIVADTAYENRAAIGRAAKVAVDVTAGTLQQTGKVLGGARDAVTSRVVDVSIAAGAAAHSLGKYL